MKTTLNIDDKVMRELKSMAAKKKKTMSELVEAALRHFMYAKSRDRSEVRELPAFHGGKPPVSIADRDALYDRMEH
jgi:predicted transcriptional regulator